MFDFLFSPPKIRPKWWSYRVCKTEPIPELNQGPYVIQQYNPNGPYWKDCQGRYDTEEEALKTAETLGKMRDAMDADRIPVDQKTF